MPEIVVKLNTFEYEYVSRAKAEYSRRKKGRPEAMPWDLFLVSIAEEILEPGSGDVI